MPKKTGVSRTERTNRTAVNSSTGQEGTGKKDVPSLEDKPKSKKPITNLRHRLYSGLATYLIILFFWSVYIIKTRSTNNGIKDQSIGILFAHPDDEVMFFGPTIANLRSSNRIYYICVSNGKMFIKLLTDLKGNADGIGHIREQELTKSFEIIVGQDKSQVLIFNHSELQDNITQSWDSQIMFDLIEESLKSRSVTLDAIITFDESGVTHHPNHVSCFEAARKLNAYLGIKMYSLLTDTMIAQYTGVFNAPIALAQARESDKFLLFGTTFNQWRTVLKAMIKGHYSQMLWFRCLHVIFSKYLVLNVLKEIA